MMTDNDIVDAIQEYVEFKMDQHEKRFDRLISAGYAIEARKSGACMDLAKEILRKIHAERRARVHD